MSESGAVSDLPHSHQDSVHVELPPESVYDLVSDVTRTGEWSPVCASCWWDDEAEAGQVGAWFTGRNQTTARTLETRSQVVVADRGREFAWVVGGNLVRWGFHLVPSGSGTTLTETWEFRPEGLAAFQERYGEDAPAQVADRVSQALDGIPKTLARIKEIAEGSARAPGTGTTRVLSETDFAAPVEDRWFEDYVPGSVYEFGHLGVSEADIVDFARRYDPQAIHDDPGWAATGPFRGLIASGVQTMALCMRLYVDHYISRVASLASPGLDEVRWPRPVRPGDQLHLRVRILDARLSRSKPDRGLVHTLVEGLNAEDQVVLSFTALNFFARRTTH
jgi:acyl dehydratase